MQIDDKHHAFFLAATDIVSSGLPESLLVQSVDVQHLVVDSLGIDEVRALTSQATQKAVESEGRCFVISAHGITVQAQNALLKLLEEPPTGTKFYILLPDEGQLLPTLRSRLSFLSSDEKGGDETVTFQTFLNVPVKDRIAIIADKTKEKDSVWIKGVVSGALAYASETGNRNLMESVTRVASSINGPGASKKMLLEELALSLK